MRRRPSSNRNQPLGIDTETEQQLWALFRIGLIVFMVFFFPNLGGALYQNVDVSQLAQDLHAANPILGLIPVGLFKFMLYTFHPLNFRYVIAPTAALVVVMIFGTRFLQDVYDLRFFRQAWRYILPSMFGIDYPMLTIDGGRRVLTRNEYNPLDVIGGPGHVLIQPGNAVLFRLLRRPSQTSVTQSYFMAPFETIGQIANLDDQHGFADQIPTMTRDGIRVSLRDVNFRYRILPDEVDGREIRRSFNNPYPFSEQAMQNMAYNLSVTENGLDPWPTAVRRVVVGVITDYVNSHSIDELTAPREKEMDPRRDLREEFGRPETRGGLRGLGVELLWIDIGHLEIQPDEIDRTRVDLWAADWTGDARTTRAFSNAIHEAYLELGRAEVQAEMIMSISHALEKVTVNNQNSANVRAILIDRVMGMLQSMNETGNQGNNQ